MKQMKQLKDEHPVKTSNVTLYQRVTGGKFGYLGARGVMEYMKWDYTIRVHKKDNCIAVEM